MKRFTPSLIDRLFDDAPKILSEVSSPSLSIDELKGTVARDVESLLNSRRAGARDSMSVATLASGSVYAFGLIDFASMSMSSAVDRQAICTSIDRAISDHEPRLHNCRVALEALAGETQKLRFSIQAVLKVHPLQEPVSFDAVLQTTTQTYAVQQARRKS